MSNIEEDIKVLENYLKHSSYKEKENDFFKGSGWEVVDLDIPQAMANVLAEREADKKRIKELEEENHLQRKQIMSAYDKGWILKQKVKDKIEEYFEDEEWLIEHDLRALCDDEKECREYYINKKIALKDIKKNILDKLNKLLNNY